jgi:FAD dependent oxidoreductase TIGR03364
VSAESFDCIVVGAGIAGLAHAWTAAREDRRVALFERSDRAQGASIRNFGMIWPVGQPAGRCRGLALRSRALWIEAAQSAKFWLSECGSLHVAHRPDEMAVLEEFAARSAELDSDCKLLNPAETKKLAPAVRADGLLGSLWSPTELAVDPREAVRAIPSWLSEKLRVQLHFGVEVRHVQDNQIETSDGRRYAAPRIVICGGADLRALFPETLAAARLRLCKLQMLRTPPQPAGWRAGPHIASGLTLRHYANFEVCSSLAALKARVARETPELDRYGIHVMLAQNGRGEAVLGDSHEYDAAIEPFDKTEIDDLMLRELRKIIDLHDWTIAERWHGIYAKCVNAPYFTARPSPRVQIVTGLGGAGMTLSFGVAEEVARLSEPTTPAAPLKSEAAKVQP